MVASFWPSVTPEATGTPSYYRAKTPPKQSPKFESRNPKNKPKHSNPKSKVEIRNGFIGVLCFLIIWICFEFRISGFECNFVCFGAPFGFAQDMLCAFARLTPT